MTSPSLWPGKLAGWVATNTIGDSAANILRSTDDRVYTEERLQKMSPSAREEHANRLIQRGELKLNVSDTFLKHIEKYIQAQKAQDNTWEQQNATKIAELKAGVARFTEKLKNLPADTPPDTVRVLAADEQNRILTAIKTFGTTPNASAAPPAATSAASAAAPPAATSVASAMTPDDAKKTNAALNALQNTFDAPTQALERELADAVTLVHLVAQAERDNIARKAARAEMDRENRARLAKLFKISNLNPANLAVTACVNIFGSTHGDTAKAAENIEAARDATRERTQARAKEDIIKNNIAPIKADLKKEEENLAKAQAALDKIDAPKKNKARVAQYEQQIKETNQKIEDYKKKIAALDAELTAQKQAAANANQNMATVLNATELKSISGQSVSVQVNANNELTFSLAVPSTIWNPFEPFSKFDTGYYVGSENNLSADVESLVQLVKESGAKSIIFTVQHDDEKTQLLMAQLAWEKCTAEFGDEKVTIKMDGQEITKENFKDILYKDKEAPKAQNAEQLKKIREEEKAEVETQRKAAEAAAQGRQTHLKQAFEADRKHLIQQPAVPLPQASASSGAHNPMHQAATAQQARTPVPATATASASSAAAHSPMQPGIPVSLAGDTPKPPSSSADNTDADDATHNPMHSK